MDYQMKTFSAKINACIMNCTFKVNMYLVLHCDVKNIYFATI